MMRTRPSLWVTCALLCCASSVAVAQDSSRALALGEAMLASSPEEFGLPSITGELSLESAFDSLTARHVRYLQVVDGVEVRGAFLYLHFDFDDRLVSAANTLVSAPACGGWTCTSDAALAAVRARFGAFGLLPNAADSMTRIWRSEGGELRASWLVRTSSADPRARIEGLVDGLSAEALSADNVLVAATGTGDVFASNPVAVLQDPSLTDMGDACYAQMMAATTTVSLEHLDGSGFLTGDWATVTSSVGPRAQSPSLTFQYCRNEDRFSEVMAYYHLDRTQQWIQDLGFTNVNNQSQALTTGDFSQGAWYDQFVDLITLGNGGVDAGEDADVILHEYGHAIHWAQLPAWPYSGEAGSITEGFADYWGESAYSRGAGSFQYGELGDWWATAYPGGTTLGTGLRSARTPKTYPASLGGWFHDDGEIWSGALFDLRETLGQEVTDTLVLESHFLLPPTPTFYGSGAALVQTSQLLYGGAYQGEVLAVLAGRGLTTAIDPYEPNDTQSAARVLQPPALAPQVITPGDHDWLTVDVQGQGGWLVMTVHGPFDTFGTFPQLPQITVTDPTGAPATIATVPASPLILSMVKVADLTTTQRGMHTIHVSSALNGRFSYRLSFTPLVPASAPPPGSGLCGDCDNNGLVNILDALSAAQAGAARSVPANPWACDVDDSGAINILDALRLAQFAAGRPVRLNCGVQPLLTPTQPLRQIACGGTAAGTIRDGTDVARGHLGMPVTTDFFALDAPPAGTTTVTISLTGAGELDLLTGAPGAEPGASWRGQYEFVSANPGANESIVLNGAALARFRGGRIPIAVTGLTPGSFMLSVSCQ